MGRPLDVIGSSGATVCVPSHSDVNMIRHVPAPARRRLAWANLALAPFVFVFLAIHFFLRNAEQLYHHPSSVGARRWSPLARWRLREFNELPHYIEHRC